MSEAAVFSIRHVPTLQLLHARQDSHYGKRLTLARHPLDRARFLDLLWKQLQQSLDDGITPLEQEGARGVLFKVTLLAHGYTFVDKGTFQAFFKDLKHEADVYERFQSSQGAHVPVFLGAIDLRSMNMNYYFDHRVYVIHMTFLSWEGIASVSQTERMCQEDSSWERLCVRYARSTEQEWPTRTYGRGICC